MSTSTFSSEARTIFDGYAKHFGASRDHAVLVDFLRSQGDSGEIFSRSNMRGHLTASALIVDDNEQSVLLIDHNRFNRMLFPGGHVDPNEGLLDAAMREALEETGLESIRPHAWHEQHKIPLDIDSHQIPANPGKSEGPHFHHDFLFIFSAAADSELKPNLNEIRSVKWAPYSEIKDLADPRMVRVGAHLARILKPSEAWSRGCESYYLGTPAHHNPYLDESKFSRAQRTDWVDGWNFAHTST